MDLDSELIGTLGKSLAAVPVRGYLCAVLAGQPDWGWLWLQHRDRPDV